MENENENLDSQNEETVDTDTESESGEVDVKSIAERLAKLEEANRQLYERAKKAEAKAIRAKVDAKVEEKLEQKRTELDDTQLDYLDLKGINDPDEIDLVKGVMQKTGQSLRQVLKDEFVQNKLNNLRRERELQDATPGATQRGGGTGDAVEYWLQRYETTGQLPKDFKLKSEVINRKVEKENGNKPLWH